MKQEALTFRDFRGGWITSEDSADLQGYRRYLNLRTTQLANGGTAIEVRPPVGEYDLSNFFESLYYYDENGVRQEDPKRKPTAGHSSFTLPVEAGYVLDRVVIWNSGLSVKQQNVLLIYKSIAANTASHMDEYDWKLFTNAPYISWCVAKDITGTENDTTRPKPSAWTDLEDGVTVGGVVKRFITAPVCNWEMLAGDIRIFLGPRYDYRILTCISEADQRRQVFNGAGSTPIDIGGQYTTDPGASVIGNGGRIRNGWLWDYGKLYNFWDSTSAKPWGVSVTPTYSTSYGLGLKPDPDMLLTFLIAPVHDSQIKQVGVPMVIRYSGKQLLFPGKKVEDIFFEIKFSHAEGSWNYRLIGFDVYLQIQSTINGYGFDYNHIGFISSDTDLARIAGFIVQPTDFHADQRTWGASQRTWATDASLSDGLGREVPELDTITSPITGLKASNAGLATALANITIRPTGAVFHKKTNYAWGIADDPSGIRIRQSAVSGALYHPDVFDVALVVWKPDARWPITRLVPYYDRILELHRTGVYYIDTPEYPVHQGTFLYAADSSGSGLPEEYYESLAVGPRGVFWANSEGIWVFRDDIPVNLLYGKIRDQWFAIPERTRRLCVGGYNNMDDEYWLAIYPSTPSGVWSFWIWSEQDPEGQGWRVYQVSGLQRTNPVRGFFEDGFKRFNHYGKSHLGDAPLITEWNIEDADLDYAVQNIFYAIETQERGSRANQIVFTGYQVSRNNDAAHKTTVSVYADGRSVPSITSAILGDNEDHIACRPMRCSTARIAITGEHSGGARPLIKEFTMYYVPDARRRR